MKTTTRLQLVFCFLLSVFLLVEVISCKKDNPATPATPAPTPTPFATVTNLGSTTQFNTGTWTVTCDSTAANNITVIGKSTGGYAIRLYTDGLVSDTGSFPIFTENSITAFFKSPTDSTGLCSNGTLHVTSFNKSKKMFSGTFYFNASYYNNTYVSISNGVFTNQVW